jgi:hypothetical protein
MIPSEIAREAALIVAHNPDRQALAVAMRARFDHAHAVLDLALQWLDGPAGKAA